MVLLCFDKDIIFLRAWYPVQPKVYYNPVQSLLLDSGTSWKGMRTNGQIRIDESIKLVQNKDSFYKPIERKTRIFNTLKIPKKLQQQLPFASKPKLMKKRGRPSLDARRAVVLEPHEKKAYNLVQNINTIFNDKQKKRKEKNKEVHEKYMKKIKAVQDIDKLKRKERAQEYFKKEGKKESRKEASEKGGRYSKKSKRGDD